MTRLLATVQFEYSASINEHEGKDKLKEESKFLKRALAGGWGGERVKLRKFELKRIKRR